MSDVSSVSSTPSAMTGAGGGQKLRILGMETGLDVDAMVEKMMTSEKIKINQAKQKQQILEWKQEAYKDIIKDIKDFQSTYFDPLNNDTYLLSPNFFSSFNVSSSNETALTATAAIGAETGTYSVSFTGNEGDEAGHLAKAAVISGSTLKLIDTTDETSISTSTTMDKLGLKSDGTLNIKCNGQDYSINVKTTDKLQDVINNISEETGGKVIARYSELTGKFTLKTSLTGESQSIQVTDESSSEVLTSLGITSSSDAITGENAVVYITPPGSSEKIKVEKSTNSFTIDGVSYNLIKEEDSSITVTQDEDKVYDKISEFLDKYNDIVDKIQTKLKEKKDFDYPPLSDEQKSQMSDSEIKAWEEKAKQGILRNDSNLENLLNDLRSAFTSPVDNNNLKFGKYGTNAIGLDTSSEVSDGGKIKIADKDKLMNAIKYNSQQLVEFFTNTSDKEDAIEKFNEQGVFTRIRDILNENVGLVGTTLNSAILTKYANLQEDYSVTGVAGSNTLPDQIYRQQKIIDELEEEYDAKQESYYEQFSKLETAMTQLNAQQMWLMQQFQ